MLTSLRVKGYQSIADATIELGPFTVIVGENRAGKSALLRALGALAFNETGTDFVRKGERLVNVAVETAEGQRILWEKDAKGGARYALEDVGEALDTRTFTKLGASVPPEIVQALGIRRIDIDQTTHVAPQFHEQGEYGFILKESAGKAARILARLTKLDIIVQAQLECRRDMQRARSDAKESESAIARLHEKLDALPDIAPVKDNLALLSSRLADVSTLVDACDQGLTLGTKWAKAEDAAAVVLPDPEILASIGRDLERLAAVSGALRRREKAEEAVTTANTEITARGNALAEAKATWDAVVTQLKLCDHCPLREGT